MVMSSLRERWDRRRSQTLQQRSCTEVESPFNFPDAKLQNLEFEWHVPLAAPGFHTPAFIAHDDGHARWLTFLQAVALAQI